MEKKSPPKMPCWLNTRDWARPALYELHMPEFNNEDHEKWFNSGKPLQNVIALKKALSQISACMDHFLCNIQDTRHAIEGIRSHAGASVDPAFLLWKLLSQVINQHIESLQSFIYWAKEKAVSGLQSKGRKEKVLDCIDEMSQEINEKIGEINGKVSQIRTALTTEPQGMNIGWIQPMYP